MSLYRFYYFVHNSYTKHILLIYSLNVYLHFIYFKSVLDVSSLILLSAHCSISLVLFLLLLSAFYLKLLLLNFWLLTICSLPFQYLLIFLDVISTDLISFGRAVLYSACVKDIAHISCSSLHYSFDFISFKMLPLLFQLLNNSPYIN